MLPLPQKAYFWNGAFGLPGKRMPNPENDDNADGYALQMNEYIV